MEDSFGEVAIEGDAVGDKGGEVEGVAEGSGESPLGDGSTADGGGLAGGKRGLDGDAATLSVC